MWDELSKAQRYRDRAEECRRVAKIGRSAEIRNHYLRMAEYYSTFAEAEEAKYQAAVGIHHAPARQSVAR
jgi:hypothetical protein